MKYYIDSCIWLNLFKKEVSKTGMPFWKIAKEFIENIMFSEDDEIIYSGIVLKEIKHKLNNHNLFNEKLLFLKQEPKFKFTQLTEKDYEFARKLESKLMYELSFYDCLHIAVCKRLNSILVTRDNYLIKIAGKYIHAEKPEYLFI